MVSLDEASVAVIQLGEDEARRIDELAVLVADGAGVEEQDRELLARLRALLRRRMSAGTGSGVQRFGRLEIDRDRRLVRVDGEERSLTGYQFDLLCALADNAGRVMSRNALMDRLKGVSPESFDRSIDVHVSRIRLAIEDEPKRPRRILTVRGAGYVFAKRQDDDGDG